MILKKEDIQHLLSLDGDTISLFFGEEFPNKCRALIHKGKSYAGSIVNSMGYGKTRIKLSDFKHIFSVAKEVTFAGSIIKTDIGTFKIRTYPAMRREFWTKPQRLKNRDALESILNCTNRKTGYIFGMDQYSIVFDGDVYFEEPYELQCDIPIHIANFALENGEEIEAADDVVGVGDVWFSFERSLPPVFNKSDVKGSARVQKEKLLTALNAIRSRNVVIEIGRDSVIRSSDYEERLGTGNGNWKGKINKDSLKRILNFTDNEIELKGIDWGLGVGEYILKDKSIL